MRRSVALAGLTLLLALAVVARDNLPAASRHHRAWVSSSLSTAAAIVALAAILIVIAAALRVVRRLRPRRDDDELRRYQEPPPRPRWLVPLLLVIVAAVIALPIVLAVLAPSGGRRSGSQAPRFTPSSRPSATAGHPSHVGSQPSPTHGLDLNAYLVLGSLAVAIAVIIAILLHRRRRATPSREAAPVPVDTRDLTARLDAARTALGGVEGDDRKAIVRCYAAMERAWAQAGARRHDSETPSELLRRASTSGLVRSRAADDLTRLFEEARYSRHPIGSEHRRRAAGDLDALLADLGRRP